MSYYTYILKCSDGTYYTGSTSNLDRRIKQHNGLIKGGAKYTRGRRPVVLVYFEDKLTKSSALQKENKLKKLSHNKKKLLVSDI